MGDTWEAVHMIQHLQGTMVSHRALTSSHLVPYTSLCSSMRKARANYIPWYHNNSSRCLRHHFIKRRNRYQPIRRFSNHWVRTLCQEEEYSNSNSPFTNPNRSNCHYSRRTNSRPVPLTISPSTRLAQSARLMPATTPASLQATRSRTRESRSSYQPNSISR